MAVLDRNVYQSAEYLMSQGKHQANSQEKSNIFLICKPQEDNGGPIRETAAACHTKMRGELRQLSLKCLLCAALYDIIDPFSSPGTGFSERHRCLRFLMRGDQ